MDCRNIAPLLLLLLLVAGLPCARASDLYRMCVVQKSITDSKVTKYCQLLEDGASKAKCVISNSRVDCLRYITEEKADFAVLNAEDIQVAVNSNRKNIVVTNELRYFQKRDYEYEVAVVVRNGANITNFSQLRGAKFCHPGYGYETDWNDLISKFFEGRIVPQLCQSNLTVTENYIKSSSLFFKAACKAGPWAPDFRLDSYLKSKYPNLCLSCENPKDCSSQDKYWGRLGPLLCLTDGSGDVAWARLDDVERYFGLTPQTEPVAPPEGYSLLCIDESMVPVTKLKRCSWIAKPWPAIVARSQVAEGVQHMISEIVNGDPGVHWIWAIQHMLNSVQQTPVPLNSIAAAEDYLRQAPGYESANTVSHCDPLRVIRICTTSDKEFSKCSWLKQTADAYGIEPRIDCIEKSAVDDCMKAVHEKAAEVVVIEPDLLTAAIRQYGIKPLIFEYPANLTDLYRTAAVVHKDSKIKDIADLKGKKACFTKYDSVGWNSAVMTLLKSGSLPTVCPFPQALGQYFSAMCVNGLNSSKAHYKSLCPTDNEQKIYKGEAGAFRCLASGKGDVAFIRTDTITRNTDGANSESWATDLKSTDFELLCHKNSSDGCYLSWSAQGQLMVDSSTSDMRIVELYEAFLKMSNFFGKHYKTPTPTFQLFGKYDGQHDLLFHDSTERFEDYSTLQEESDFSYNYEKLLSEMPQCKSCATWDKGRTYYGLILLSLVFILM